MDDGTVRIMTAAFGAFTTVVDEPEEEMSQAEWLAKGVELGFCTNVYCSMHDGWPAEDNEMMEAAFDEVDDPCMAVVRLKQL
jgi:hypothetical protein